MLEKEIKIAVTPYLSKINIKNAVFIQIKRFEILKNLLNINKLHISFKKNSINILLRNYESSILSHLTANPLVASTKTDCESIFELFDHFHLKYLCAFF